MRVLLSYYFLQHHDLETGLRRHFPPPQPLPEVFLDSGAFSAHTQGVRISLHKYCEYVTRFKHLLATYANLDVIGDARETKRNQEIMEQEGLAPLPVFHVGDPWHYLQMYLERYSYIALGGMVPYLQDHRYNLMPWLLKCFRLAGQRTVFHGFGCTAWKLISALPWYSVDSSTWSRGIRFGEVSVFDRRTGTWARMSLGDHTKCYRYAASFRAVGLDPADFADRSRNTREKTMLLAVRSFQAAERWLTERHSAPVKLYLACNEAHLSSLAQSQSQSQSQTQTKEGSGAVHYLENV